MIFFTIKTRETQNWNHGQNEKVTTEKIEKKLTQAGFTYVTVNITLWKQFINLKQNHLYFL